MEKTKKEVIRKAWSSLSFTEKILPLAIILSIVLGVLLSVYVPSSRTAFDQVEVINVSAPLAIGMIVMMIPPLCKVEWENLHVLVRKKKYMQHIIISLILNWIICPFIMFGLAWMTLFDKDEYRIGIIMIGLARCIAMVMVWNEIAGGDHNLCAILVLINSILQIVLYAPYQMFFCYIITSNKGNMISYSIVAKSVAFFLGIPLGFGLVIRLSFLFSVGVGYYEKNILPFISPFAFIGLIYTIIVIFIQRGNEFIKHIGDAFRCFVPLILYFIITWFGTFFILRILLGKTKPNVEGYASLITQETINDNLVITNYISNEDINDGADGEIDFVTFYDDTDEKPLLCGCEKQIISNQHYKSYKMTNCSAYYNEIITQTFTAASNNFELSLAIAISIYGSGSKESIAATFGPLIEVPILLVLCLVAKYLQYGLLWNTKNIEH